MNMQINKKWCAALVVAGAGCLAAGAAQAQVTIGAPITPGVYGQIVIGNGAPPPVYVSTPVVVRPVAAPQPPVYLYVPDGHRRHWARYCGRYNACGRPVYFVNGHDPRARRFHYEGQRAEWRGDRREDRREWRHDEGRHLGWERGVGNPHRD